MTRPFSLGLLFFIMLIIYMKLGSMFMWILSAVAFAALITIVVLMYRRDMYVGPSTLVDDVRRVRDRMTRDEGGEADRVQAEAIATRESMLEEDEIEQASFAEGRDGYTDTPSFRKDIG